MAEGEAISIFYMLRCLGILVSTPTNLYCNNLSVIQSANIPDSELKKKDVAISYHYIQEAITAGSINAIRCKTSKNFADICTKALGNNAFKSIADDLMV